MDVMMIFRAAENTTICILLACYFLPEKKLLQQIPKFAPHRDFGDYHETSSRQSNI